MGILYEIILESNIRFPEQLERRTKDHICKTLEHFNIKHEVREVQEDERADTRDVSR